MTREGMTGAPRAFLGQSQRMSEPATSLEGVRCAC
jgi:hypothetical protein